MIEHHPSEALLADYASGALPDGPSLVVSAHLERCACCRKAKTLFEAVAGQALDEIAPVEMSSDALAQALASLERQAPRRPQAARRRPKGLALPAALAERTIGRRRFVAPGMWVAQVCSKSPEDWRTYLLRAPPGAAVPEHGHEGPEYTAVLAGAYRDGASRYGPGDFAACDEGDSHALEADGSDPCLCLISSRGRMRARGVVSLLQGWLGV